jgi:hypothetical protein
MGSTGSPRPGAADRLRALARAARAAPRVLVAAAVLLAAQGLVLVGLGVFQAVRGFGGGIDDVGRAEFGGVLAVLAGLVVLLLARSLLVDRSASRSPIVVIELLCLPVGWALSGEGHYEFGVPLLAVAVAILVLLGVAGAFTGGARRTER